MPSLAAVLGFPPEWQRPWFVPLATDAGAVHRALCSGSNLPQALTGQIRADGAQALAHGPRPLRFVPQSDLPDGVPYESHIFDTGCVPTRENLHDFFNGLIWLRFPATKRRLNQLQAGEIAAAGVGAVRGRVRDALTLFDENAALLQAPPPIWEALLARDWHRLFGEQRPLWAQARLVLFGHALLEKLVQPYKSITAHVYRTPVPMDLQADLAAWDDWLAHVLSREEMASKPFTPLPLLGVPGWWAANADPTFYEDASVFRPLQPRVERAPRASP
jgi:hypothetical protein